MMLNARAILVLTYIQYYVNTFTCATKCLHTVCVCICDIIADCLKVMQKKPSTTIKPSVRDATQSDATRSDVIAPTPLPSTESEVSSGN